MYKNHAVKKYHLPATYTQYVDEELNSNKLKIRGR